MIEGLFLLMVFDNVLVGISYLSRVQESAAKSRLGNPIPISTVMKSSPSPSVADSLFMQRIKLRVQHWKKACTDSRMKTDGRVLTVLLF